ncbi:hypothetical protein [Tsukamurella spumae]|uniref:DUF2637 domain-containing protein n=1 Tax=Tsukamurella spumae TaxID=44753 RepID=A0A846X5E5_9ACTN|nr:hypothetical protein [Tsukamurella spumae]NKY19736.1 hypothetical protein [Tsukamurella spumae]
MTLPTLFRRRPTATPTPVQRARRYFARLIWLSLALSIIGNALHNIASIAVSLPVQVVLSIIPPILLALLIHGLSHLAAAQLGGALYNCAAGAVAVLAAGAGVVSFVTLQSLALMPYQAAGSVHGGWPEGWAFLLPVLLDVPVVVATAVLVSIDRAAMRTAGATVTDDAHQADALAPEGAGDGADPAPGDARPIDGTAPASDPDTGASVSAPGPHQLVTSGDALADALTPEVVHPSDAPDAEPRTTDFDVVRDGAPEPHQGDALASLAEALVRAGRTTADPETVHIVLMRTVSGASSRRVAEEVDGLSYSAVQRIVRAAREMGELPTVDSASTPMRLVG